MFIILVDSRPIFELFAFTRFLFLFSIYGNYRNLLAFVLSFNSRLCTLARLRYTLSGWGAVSDDKLA